MIQCFLNIPDMRKEFIQNSFVYVGIYLFLFIWSLVSTIYCWIKILNKSWLLRLKKAIVTKIRCPPWRKNVTWNPVRNGTLVTGPRCSHFRSTLKKEVIAFLSLFCKGSSCIVRADYFLGGRGRVFSQKRLFISLGKEECSTKCFSQLFDF